jgi:arylsulfatase A-like enzyme
MVERLDADTGRVMAAVKELGLDKNTLVLFASDNGAGGEDAINACFGSRAGMRGAKGTLREGGIRVPFIARWPGKVPAGRSSKYATAFWDFLPTAAELAGAKAPPGIDGVSIVPTLLGRPQKPRAYLYWEQRSGSGKLTRAVRMGDWKGYQEATGSPIELYDLKSDRAETTDVAASHPDVVTIIGKIMTGARVDVTPPEHDSRIRQKYLEDNRKLDELLAR